MNNYILDTNILVYFFEGSAAGGKIIKNDEFIISAITYIEILANPGYSRIQRSVTKEFLNTKQIIHSSPVICDLAIQIRLNYKCKLPDCIIAATAQFMNLPLITADTLLLNIKEIDVIKFQK